MRKESISVGFILNTFCFITEKIIPFQIKTK